ncbi:MAG: endonuclease [Bacilli bacterium]|nr:endonuclease [Bacilli bacterium]
MKMNKKAFGIASLFTIFALGIGLIANANKPHTEVDASSYSVRSVPTTIDLNDASESTIRGYYNSLNDLSENERKGTNLLKNLKPILKNGQKYLSYGSSATTAVWKAYEIVDRDWNKSPASAISGYNAQTNIITGYVYGSSNSNVGSNPYIHALYVNRNVENQQRAWGNHNQVQWGINQEHLWAKSCGFQDESPAAGARGDLMHLWAGNGRVNGDTHSNYYYGYVDTTKSYDNAGNYASTLSGNLRGYSKTLGGPVTVFEPQDSDKGDIARAIFYMAARYNYLSGSDSDGIDAGNPNLEIVNDVTSWQNSGYQSTTTRTGKMGIIQDLLKWNEIDPPDEFEIHRNNLLYNNFTNNRNPFIDFPSWANAIWGTVDANGNYNSTPTTYAMPSTDTIGTSTITPVFGISNTQLSLEVGDTATISARNANGNITWSVANSAVASLDKTTTENNEDVTVTALSAGSTTITATNGGDSATCQVTVTDGSGSTTDEYVKVASYDFSTGNTSTSAYSNETNFLQRFNNSVQTGTGLSNIVTGISSIENVYAGYSNYLSFGLKLGTSSLNGGFTATLNRQVSRVVVNAAGWTTSDSISVGDAAPQTPGVAYGGSDPIKTLTFDITSSSSIEFDYNQRGFIQSIDFYAVEEVTDNPRNHLNNISPVFYLTANEDESGTGDVTKSLTFSSLGLENSVQYSDPFEIDDGITITFAGGSNDGRYYDGGTGIRTYANGTITINSSKTLSRVVLTWDGSNKPASSDSVNVGIYNTSTGVWTGYANTIIFTRPSGSGHWRLQSVQVTYTDQTVTVDNVKMRFGAAIPVDDWYDIEASWDVDYYGVMFLKYDTLHTTYGYSSIEDAYEDGIRPRADVHTENGNTPLPVNGNLVFTARINMTSELNYGVVYVAAPYLVIDGTHYFLEEMEYSVNSMAQEYLDNDLESTLSTAALTKLATPTSQGD